MGDAPCSNLTIPTPEVTLAPVRFSETLQPRYYAAFVIDPDGHNVEALFQGP